MADKSDSSKLGQDCEAGARESSTYEEFVTEVEYRLDAEGSHGRPTSHVLDLAETFQSSITLTNLTDGFVDEPLDAKSFVEACLLGALYGSIIRICCKGPDAAEAGMAMAKLLVEGLSHDRKDW